jgi:hypothetical protein
VNLSLSVATVAGDAFSNDCNRQTVDIFNIPDGWEGMDASEESLGKLEEDHPRVEDHPVERSCRRVRV